MNQLILAQAVSFHLKFQGLTVFLLSPYFLLAIMKDLIVRHGAALAYCRSVEEAAKLMLPGNTVGY